MTQARSLRAELKARPDLKERYTRKPFIITLDQRLMHSDRTLYDVMDFQAYPDVICRNTITELADVMATDRHQVRRSLRRLETCEYIHRVVGGYELLLSPAQKSKPKSVDPTQRCRTCLAQKPLDKMGICPVCRKQDQADAEVRMFLRDSPAAVYEMVYIGLKAHGSKCSARDLEKAYRRVTTPLNRGKITA